MCFSRQIIQFNNILLNYKVLCIALLVVFLVPGGTHRDSSSQYNGPQIKVRTRVETVQKRPISGYTTSARSRDPVRYLT